MYFKVKSMEKFNSTWTTSELVEVANAICDLLESMSESIDDEEILRFLRFLIVQYQKENE
jgi:hypothetical protein